MLITFILSFSLFWGDSNLDFCPPTSIFSELFLSLLLFYPLVEIQKKKTPQGKSAGKIYKYLEPSLLFSPLHHFFFLLLIISGHFLKKNS